MVTRFVTLLKMACPAAYAETATPRLDGCATTYGTDKIIHENDYVWTIDSPLPWFSFDPGHQAVRDRRFRRRSCGGARVRLLTASQPSGPKNCAYSGERDRHSGERDRWSVLRVLILCRLGFPAVFPYLELDCF